jgi:predicted DNA-binding antitoxin AbrB/MazE fold protein
LKLIKTIRAIFRDGSFKPLDPVNLPENTRLTVALFDGDDLSADAIAELARTGQAFDFLNDAREDLYGDSDGEAV